jgi:peptide/nickel transport system substrate-binding protein
VRAALALLVDRRAIQEHVYGRLGQTTANVLNVPGFESSTTRWAFDPDRASQLLEAAGWQRGVDGVRAKGGTALRMVFQTSINALRQNTQAGRRGDPGRVRRRGVGAAPGL